MQLKYFPKNKKCETQKNTKMFAIWSLIGGEKEHSSSLYGQFISTIMQIFSSNFWNLSVNYCNRFFLLVSFFLPVWIFCIKWNNKKSVKGTVSSYLNTDCHHPQMKGNTRLINFERNKCIKANSSKTKRFCKAWKGHRENWLWNNIEDKIKTMENDDDDEKKYKELQNCKTHETDRKDIGANVKIN